MGMAPRTDAPGGEVGAGLLEDVVSSGRRDRLLRNTVARFGDPLGELPCAAGGFAAPEGDVGRRAVGVLDA